MALWRAPKAAPVPSATVAPVNEVRVITGKYNIAGRYDLRTGQRTFYACRVEQLDEMELALSVPVTGDLGQSVLVKIERLGDIQGVITKQVRRGFVMSVAATNTERAKLKAKIAWFEKFRHQQIDNKRTHDRFTPEDPHSTLILADGNTMRCFVIDMSSSGAAVSARVTPDTGTPLAIGKVVGRVVRHLPSGFAVRFIQELDINTLEELLIKRTV
jgi:hypothetical protein